MIKDVKSYFQTVAGRLSNAFAVEEFDTEQELEFWSLAAEHMSREETPSFRDIVKWMDLLFRAPVHFVYVKGREEKLRLFRRQVISENLEYLLGAGDKEDKRVRKQMHEEFEDRLANIETKISFNEEMETPGMSSFTIGRSQHIPLFDGDDFWGLYCVGPYVSTPDSIVPRISIVGRLLSDWLIDLHESENQSRHKFKDRFEEEVGDLHTGTLNVEGIAKLLIGFEQKRYHSHAVALVQREEQGLQVVSQLNLDKEWVNYISQVKVPDSTVDYVQSDAFHPEQKEGLKAYGAIVAEEITTGIFLLYFVYEADGLKDSPGGEGEEKEHGKVRRAIGELLRHRDRNLEFSKELLDSFYAMLRRYEKRSERTQYHTPRLVALCEKFSELFGLEADEKERLLLTAKFHDIGYVGISLFSSKRSVAVELEHPLVGQKMVAALPIHEEIKRGIATHHEWIDGSGTPFGLREEEIPWTGKIVGAFEYIVEFIETHQNDQNREPEEWLEQLSSNLLERADKQLDMVLIPTIIELLGSLEWEGCCDAGVET